MSDEISKEIKKDFKQFVKKLKNFKKVSSVDFNQGEKLAKELLKEAKSINSKCNINSDEKMIRQLEKLTDGLNLYLSNVDSLKEFDKKWGVKKK